LIDHDLTITGPGATSLVISADDASRIFQISADTTVSISNLAFAHGYTPETPLQAGFGGAIANKGHLTLADTRFFNNLAWSGGALSNGVVENEEATMTILRSYFFNNTARNSGGALDASTAGFISVTDSTFIDNSALTGEAGALDFDYDFKVTNSTFIHNTVTGENGVGGAIYNAGTASVVANSTFINNQANNTNPIYCGGAIGNDGGEMTIINSTFSGNTTDAPAGSALCGAGGIKVKNSIFTGGLAAGLPNNCDANVNAEENNNIESGTDCGFISTGDLQNTDPLLGTIADNGGLTQTIALLLGSPAIDAGDDTICAASPVNGLDQRGIARPSGSHCDIGAFEFVTTPSADPEISTPPPVTHTSGGHRRPINISNPVSVTAPSVSSTSTTRFIFSRDLKLGSNGNDVRELQKFLNVHGYIISSTGPGSIGNETTYFGFLTKKALINYQKAMHIVPSVGFFGPITRAIVML
jgi:hypothetical protein